MIIKRVSPLTGRLNNMYIDVTIEQLMQWKEGRLIQDVMPSLTSAEREFIMTGYTPEDWEVLRWREE